MRCRLAAIAMFAAYGPETLCLLVANGKIFSRGGAYADCAICH
jgi:hypothetical protein